VSDRDGLVAGRYRLVERIATGGMGVVWRGWDERLRRVVAIKELLVHPGLGEAAAEQAAHRAMREARITARLQHPHAIPVYDVVEHDGRPCLIMEYVPSRSLQNVLTERTTLGVDEVATIGSQIAAALSAAHRAGIVHRDVKPGNVLLAEDGTAKLTDFGISRAFGDVTVTTTGMVTGTPAYLAPEVASGNPAGFPADVFSLGSTLYAALEGHPPFGTQGNPIAILHRVASGHVIPPRRCGRLTPVINEMLQHNPASRPTMRQVEQALSIAAAGGVAPAASRLLVSPSQQTQQLTLSANPPAKPMPPPAPPPPPPPSPTPTRHAPLTAAPAQPRRRRGLLIAAAVAILLVLSGALLALVTTINGGGKTTGSSLTTAPLSTARSATTPAATTTSLAPPAAAGAPPVSAAATAPATPASAGGSQSPSTSAAAVAPSTGADAISSYYALVPNDLSDAWAKLTASYQESSGGIDSYQQFWSTIAQVTATEVSMQDDGSVQATITYVYKDGKVVAERTSFGLARDDGQLKINSSHALSSHTQ
jgi:eukaryotic-like serine/threonine-protein kinase